MTPMECCDYLNIGNTFMVPMGVKVDRRKYNKSFKRLRGVGWDCFQAAKSPEKIERILWGLIDPAESSDFCHRIVQFGREICRAIGPRCDVCPLGARGLCKKRETDLKREARRGKA